MKKILLHILISLAAIILLLVLAVNIILSPKISSRIVASVCGSYLDAELNYSRLDISLFKSFPFTDAVIDQFVLNKDTDTLASFDRLHVSVNIPALIKGKINLHRAELEGLRLNAHIYDSTSTNWDIFKSDDSTESEESFSLPDISIGIISIRDSRILCSYLKDSIDLNISSIQLSEHRGHADLSVDAEAMLLTENYGRIMFPVNLESEFGIRERNNAWTVNMDRFIANIANIPFSAEGEFKYQVDSVYMDAVAVIESYPAMDIISNYVLQFIPELEGFSTDAGIGATAEVKGWLGFSGAPLPWMRMTIEVPESRFSYDGYFEDGDFDLKLIVENKDNGQLYAELEDLCFIIPGVDLNMIGSIDDLMADDPLIDMTAFACTEFAELVKYLPEDMDYRASGDVDFELGGKLRLSQLDPYQFSKADFEGHIYSDYLYFASPSDSLSAFIASPDLRIAMNSKSYEGLGVSVAIDSVRMAAGSDTYIMGSRMSASAHSSESLNPDMSSIPALSADMEIGNLNMRGSDSLMLGLRNSTSKLIFTRYDDHDKVNVSVRSSNRMLMARSGAHRATLQNIDIAAGAHKHSEEEKQREFNLHEVDLQLEDDIVSLIKDWHPSGSVSIKQGTIATPMLPLRNSISNFSGSFNDNELGIRSIALKSGDSDISANGSITGFRPMLIGQDGSKLDFNLELRSSFLNMNELLSALSLGTDYSDSDLEALDDDSYAELIAYDSLSDNEIDSDDYSLMLIPDNFDADVILHADSVRYAGVIVDDFGTELQIQDKTFQITNSYANTNIGDLFVEGFYSTESKEDIKAGFNLEFYGITADKVIEIFPEIDSLVPMLKSFKGQMDCELAATTSLDSSMNVIIPSLNGVARINGTGLELEDTGDLRRLAQILMFKDTKVGHIKDIAIDGVISNNQLVIYPFIMGIDRYTLAMNGRQGFDQNFKYHISVIKSPLPFKFGVNIKGNFDDWSYSLGKAKFKSEKIPVMTSEIDTLQINLVASIKDIFKKGVDAAIKENNKAGLELDVYKEENDWDDLDLLENSEMEALDSYLLELEIEEETQRLMEEIENELAKNL